MQAEAQAGVGSVVSFRAAFTLETSLLCISGPAASMYCGPGWLPFTVEALSLCVQGQQISKLKESLESKSGGSKQSTEL
jgi:hypothetical protein